MTSQVAEVARKEEREAVAAWLSAKALKVATRVASDGSSNPYYAATTVAGLISTWCEMIQAGAHLETDRG